MPRLRPLCRCCGERADVPIEDHQPDSALVVATLGRAPSAVNRAGWVVFALLVVLLVGQLFKGVDPQDEGQFLTYPWLISHGYMPYRDVWMSYPPAVYCFLAVLFKFGLPGLVAERGLAFVSVLAYVLLINRLVTGAWTRFSWVAVPLTYSLIFMSADIRAYPWLLALPVFLLGLHAARTRPGMAASLFFVAGTMRFEFVVAGVIALVAEAVLSTLMRETNLKPLVSGLGLTGVTAAFYLALNAVTAGRAINAIFFDQVGKVEAGRWLPLIPPQFSPLGWPVLVLALLGPLMLLCVALRVRQVGVASGTLAVAALSPHFFQRADSSHLFSFASLAIPWTLVGLVIVLREGGKTAPVWTKRATRTVLWYTAIACTAWSFLIVLAYAVYLSPLSPIASEPIYGVGSRFVPAGSHTIISWDDGIARDERRLSDYLRLHAGPHDTIFIAPLTIDPTKKAPFYYTMTDLYYALGLTPASRYMEMQAGLTNQPKIQLEIARDLLHCTWVVLIHGGVWYTGPPVAPTNTPILYEREIRRTYHPVLQTPTYELEVRNSSLR